MNNLSLNNFQNSHLISSNNNDQNKAKRKSHMGESEVEVISSKKAKFHNIENVTTCDKILVESTKVEYSKKIKLTIKQPQSPIINIHHNDDSLKGKTFIKIKFPNSLKTEFHNKLEESGNSENKHNGLQEFADPDGDILNCNFVNGILEGPASRTFANGDVEEFTFVNGVSHGPALYTFANGIIEHFTFVNGIKDGPAMYQYTNGDISNFSYLNGGREGPATYTFSNGEHFTVMSPWRIFPF